MLLQAKASKHCVLPKQTPCLHGFTHMAEPYPACTQHRAAARILLCQHCQPFLHRTGGGKTEGLRAAQTENGPTAWTHRGPTAALGWPHQTEAAQGESWLGIGQSKDRFTAEIKPREKCLALEVLELLFNPKTAQLSELRIEVTKKESTRK